MTGGRSARQIPANPEPGNKRHSLETKISSLPWRGKLPIDYFRKRDWREAIRFIVAYQTISDYW